MKEANVWVRYKKKYKATTNSEHNKPIYPNELKQDFAVAAVDEACVGDVTYILTSEGWLYLCIVIDLYSCKLWAGAWGQE
jgi:transposase InsO family protein